MQYFFESSDTIKKGLGFSHFSPIHIMWLSIFVVLTAFMCFLYIRSNEKGRKIIRITLASLTVLDEVFKIVGLASHGNYTASYLPLHLCSINIFIIAIHAIKPIKTLSSFLYTVCVPAAIAALLFPTWTKLPLANFMHIHSFTVHILLAMYPIILFAAKEIRPKLKDLPKTMALLLFFAFVAFCANCIFDTNFMFLRSASKGNPLYYFEVAFGNHLIGFPVLIFAIVLVMYMPIVIKEKVRQKRVQTVQ